MRAGVGGKRWCRRTSEGYGDRLARSRGVGGVWWYRIEARVPCRSQLQPTGTLSSTAARPILPWAREKKRAEDHARVVARRGIGDTEYSFPCALGGPSPHRFGEYVCAGSRSPQSYDRTNEG